MNIKLKEIYPDLKSDIKVTYHIGCSDNIEYADILVVKFTGVYRSGSSGNPDATYLYAKGEYGLSSVSCSGLILDMSELEYEYGDMMDAVFGIGAKKYLNKTFPTASIVGPMCKKGISTLMHGQTSPHTIFDTLEEAWKYIEEEIRNIENALF